MHALIQQAAGFGFAAGSIPGPLHTFLVNETLVRGFRHSYLIIFTPLFSDTPIIILTTFILGQLPTGLINIIRIVGGVFLLWLARSVWRQSTSENVIVKDTDDTLPRFSLYHAMLVNWLNPAPWVFWGTVLGPLFLEALEESLLHGIGFLGAFYGVFLTMMLAIALIFNRVRGLDARVVRWAMRVAALLLTFFSLSLILEGTGIT